MFLAALGLRVHYLLLFRVCLGLEYSEIKDTLEKGLGNYSTAVRPLLNQSEHVTVSISWYLLKITAVRESEQTLRATSFLMIYWHDKILEQALKPLCKNGELCQSFFSETYEHNTEEKYFHVPASMLWLPDLRIYNAQGKFDFDTDDTMLTLYYSGDVSWQPGGQFETSCDMDVRKFPFDSHKCHMDIGPWQSHNQKVVSETTGADLMFFEEDGEWQITNTYTSNASYIIGGCCRYTIVIQRRPEMLVTTVMLPTTLLSFIGTLVFKLPTVSGERISLSVSITLALILYLTIIQTTLPRSVTKPSYFEILLCTEVVFNLINIFMTVVSITIYHKGTWKLKQGSLLFILMTRICPVKTQLKENIDGHELDIDSLGNVCNNQITANSEINPNNDDGNTNGYHFISTASFSRVWDTASFAIAFLANVIVLVTFIVMVVM